MRQVNILPFFASTHWEAQTGRVDVKMLLSVMKGYGSG